MPTTIPQRTITIRLVAIGSNYAQVSELLNIPIRKLQVVHDHFIADAPRSADLKSKRLLSIKYHQTTYADLAGELRSKDTLISAMTMWHILKKAGLRKTKPTRKPGLTRTMKS
ncbi:hypothetical protein N7509_012045 [Penicillium cosmopolitanum]|uniref:Transposase Tc1-like domain-containing protein n=1 Tax=Penicillium cosmopolitanum TaxID=1131564 RepID=A0A9W9VGW0_9EURO|nr:uncharacterized protein N7509_012045 [Penicillium cosmopolitanum]KAJ5378926.1 hypothetical protein N7509_012045 [Penicillium cosmopolitanum]